MILQITFKKICHVHIVIVNHTYPYWQSLTHTHINIYISIIEIYCLNCKVFLPYMNSIFHIAVSVTCWQQCLSICSFIMIFKRLLIHKFEYFTEYLNILLILLLQFNVSAEFGNVYWQQVQISKIILVFFGNFFIRNIYIFFLPYFIHFLNFSCRLPKYCIILAYYSLYKDKIAHFFLVSVII